MADQSDIRCGSLATGFLGGLAERREWAGGVFAGRLRSRPGEQSLLGLIEDSAPGQALQFDADVVDVVRHEVQVRYFTRPD
ncbi:hypothetical protein [Streptomyces mirabilis]|uniref:hypothetical protein n=1 Tax=Streptomyces mirabilis TaxID=68239 RepID=UPI0033AE650F